MKQTIDFIASKTIVLVFAVLLLLAITVIGIASGISVRDLLSTLIYVYTNPSSLATAVLYSGPIIASALGLAIAYKAFFISIGAEGQVLVSGLTALWLLAYVWPEPGNHYILLALFSSIALGSLWGILPGLLKAYAEVNEVLTSLMLNYVALSVVNYAVSGPLRWGPFTITKEIPDNYTLGPLAIIAFAVALSGLYSFILWRTRLGLAIESLGLAPKAASTYGYDNRKTIVYVSLLAGASSGLGGFLMVTGFQWSFKALSEPPGYGYMGVLVAWMSSNNPALVLPLGYLFSTILVAAKHLQGAGMPLSSVLALEAVMALTAAFISTRRRQAGLG